MIKLTENLWIGDSSDERHADLASLDIAAVLNVAHDLGCTRRHPGIGPEYAHVGLVDGPGNTVADYCAAVLALATLVRRRGRVLVCCHSGGRAMAVALMYLDVVWGMHGWEWCLEILRERVDADLPVPHAAHRAVFERIDVRLLAGLLED